MSDGHPIYLDYNATTPIDPAVREAMLPYLSDHFGNPSSTHAYGKEAHAAVENARRQVADLIGAEPDEIVFTGGGSEASNQAIKGTCLKRPRGLMARLFGSSLDSFHIITTAVEHPATLQPIDFLRRLGCPVTIMPVDRFGRIDAEEFALKTIGQTRLVSIMHSNNEVGTLMPMREVAEHCRVAGILLHTDCAQSVGKIPVNVRELGVDLLTIAGHKLYAPKGIGALYVRRGVALEPLIHGAGHEGGRRAGTENVPYIVALGRAAALAMERLPEYSERVRALRDTLHRRILERVPNAALNGHSVERLPNTLNLSFPGVNAAALLAAIRDQVACSTGSACHAGHAAPSQVLLAMGRDAGLAAAALRLSLGWARPRRRSSRQRM